MCQSCCVLVPLCSCPSVPWSHCIPVSLCPTSIMSQPQSHCVLVSLCPSPIMSQAHCALVLYATVPLHPSLSVSQSHYVPVPLCPSPIVFLSCCVSVSRHCIPIPLYPCPIDQLRIDYIMVSYSQLYHWADWITVGLECNGTGDETVSVTQLVQYQ